MSHHGMHIPPNLMPLTQGPQMLEKLKEAKKKEQLKQTASTGGFGELDELNDEDELDDALNRKRRGRGGNSGGQPEDRPGGKPMQQQMSDKTVKVLLRAQEGAQIED